MAALDRSCRLLPEGSARDIARERLIEALVQVGRVDAAFDASRTLVVRLTPARAAAVHLRLAGAALTASRWDLAEAAAQSTPRR